MASGTLLHGLLAMVPRLWWVISMVTGRQMWPALVCGAGAQSQQHSDMAMVGSELPTTMWLTSHSGQQQEVHRWLLAISMAMARMTWLLMDHVAGAQPRLPTLRAMGSTMWPTTESDTLLVGLLHQVPNCWQASSTEMARKIWLCLVAEGGERYQLRSPLEEAVSPRQRRSMW
jgi:hypothetical protein